MVFPAFGEQVGLERLPRIAAGSSFPPTRIPFDGSVGASIAEGEVQLTATWYREEPGREYWVPFPEFDVDDEGHTIAVPVEDHPGHEEARLRSKTLALSYAHPSVLGHAIEISAYCQDQIYDQRDNLFGCCLTKSEHSRRGLRSTFIKQMDVGRTRLTASYGFDYTRNRYFRPEFELDGSIVAFVSPEVILETYALFAQGEVELGRFRATGGTW